MHNEVVSVKNIYGENVINVDPISCHRSVSVTIEIIKEPLVFLCFQEGIEID